MQQSWQPCSSPSSRPTTGSASQPDPWPPSSSTTMPVPWTSATRNSTASRPPRRRGVFIPHYCWHPALTVVASCRMCLVEVGEKKPDGSIAMQPKVVPGCQTPAKDGTVIVTDSAKAQGRPGADPRRLLLNHPLDCPVCDKAGECLLQDYSYGFGRAAEPDDRREEHAAQQAAHRRQHHAVHRSLHHVLALCPLHPRDQRHGRVAGHQPRRPFARSTSSPATAQQQAGHQRRRSLPGRSAVQQGLPLQAARLEPQDPEERLPRLLHGMQHPPRRQQEHRLSAAAARQPARRRATSCATTAGWAITTSTRRIASSARWFARTASWRRCPGRRRSPPIRGALQGGRDQERRAAWSACCRRF